MFLLLFPFWHLVPEIPGSIIREESFVEHFPSYFFLLLVLFSKHLQRSIYLLQNILNSLNIPLNF